MTENENITVTSVLREAGWDLNSAVLFAQFRKQELNTEPDSKTKQRSKSKPESNKPKMNPKTAPVFIKSITSHGNCLTFDKSTYQITPGAGNGLKVAFNVQQDSYSRFDSKLLRYLITIKTAFLKLLEELI